MATLPADHYKDPLYANIFSAHFELIMLPFWACASGLGADDWYGRIVAEPVNELARSLNLKYTVNHGFLHSDYELLTEERVSVFIPKSDLHNVHKILELAAKGNLKKK